MNQLQAWESSESSYLMTFRQTRNFPSVTLYNDNDYTRLLNQVLAVELGATHLHNLCRKKLEGPWYKGIYENHLQAAKEINCLIVANRGIPNKDGLAISAEISVMLTRVTAHIGSKIARQTARRSSVTLESILRRRYHSAINMAPAGDKAQLSELLKKTKSNLIILEQDL